VSLKNGVTYPYDIDSKIFDVVKLGVDARKISKTISIGIFEGSWVDLIYRSFLPPGSLHEGLIWCHDEFLKVQRGIRSMSEKKMKMK